MKQTKRLIVVIAMALILVACALLTGCTGTADTTTSHDHQLVRVAPKAATCLDDGNREYYTCSGCDEIFADEDGTMKLSGDKHIISAKGHKIAKHSEKSATCYTTGVGEYYECRNCGVLFSDAEGKNVINAPETLATLKHSLTKIDEKQPSGFVAGWEEHYSCDNCGKLYKDASASVETTLEEIKIAPSVSNFDYKIAFTPAANLENNGYITAQYVEGANGYTATQFNIPAGTPNGTSTYAWINQVVTNCMGQGVNLRIPSFSGQERVLEMTFTNDGAESITFEYYAENNGHRGGVTVTLEAGETKTVTFSVNPGTSIGCNYVLVLKSTVSSATKLTMNGFFHCEGEVDSISLYKQASKTTFKVGDKFTTEGLVVKAHGNQYDDVVIANFLTSIEEGYTFTASDVGTKVVTVAYGEYTVTYEITVTN